MKFGLKTLLYIVLAVCAIFVGLTYFDTEPLSEEPVEVTTQDTPVEKGPRVDFRGLEALRVGEMRKLNFSDPKRFVGTAFLGEDGQPANLNIVKGQYTVLNFWATWCAPCRKEMPTLDALDKVFEGKGLDVMTIAVGRNPAPVIKKFFNQIGVENLTKHLDPTQALARDMGVLGLPVTVVLNHEAREIARLTGDADWDSPEAIAILTALLEEE